MVKSRWWVAAFFSAVIAAGAAHWLLGGGPDYSHVATIEHTAEFRNPALLARAEQLPVAEAYLSRPFEYQHNASVCGPTSAADLLHSLGRARNQTQVIADGGVGTVLGYVIPGLTLDQEATLLRKETGAPVTLLRNLDLSGFRALLPRVNDRGWRVIVNFHRGPMFGRGHGHFSPLLAYLPDRDLVLVGDVNSAYGIYLVSSKRLFDAMDTIDSMTGKKRGLLVVRV
jgi:hypothetical protein